MEEEQLDDDNKNTYCQDSIDRVEGERKPVARDIKRRKMPFLTSSEQLGATDGMDAVTKSIAELSATIAKATKIRQDEHLCGPVILPVEDERLILSGCGDYDSLELFPGTVAKPNSDAALHRDVKRGVAHMSIWCGHSAAGARIPP